MAPSWFLLLTTALVAAALSHLTAAWGSSSDRVLLSEIKTLTLHNGRMTTGRRSSPVSQLKCTGGSAGCSRYVPPVVQCQNQGTDGYDIQWECKADLDNAYRFGKIEVTCEGYDHADDEFILRGSCGLEYALELTKEGYHQENQHNEHRSSGYHGHDGSSYGRHSSHQHGSNTTSHYLGNLILLAIVGVVIYAIYHTCIAPPAHSDNRSGPPPRGGPSPYGFRDNYTDNTPRGGGNTGGGCSDTYGSSQSYTSATPGANAGGGFWTGAATGGLMGYLFGSRTNQSYHNQYHRAPTNSWGSGFGGFGSSRSTYSTPSFGGGFGGSGSTGTRTASGFGGTRRR